MRRIDCHLLADHAREGSALAMIQSLASEPINILVAPARPGDMTGARVDAIRCGRAEYVCWVDDDDAITPGVFSRLAHELDAHPEACGAFTSEAHVRDGRVESIRPALGIAWSQQVMIDQHPFVHHVALFRRVYAERYLHEISQFPRVGDQLLLWLVSLHGPWVHVPIVGYHWHRHAGQTSAHADIAAELAAAKQYFWHVKNTNAPT